MARERPNLSVKNDVVTISPPYIGDAKKTYTTASIAATGTTLTVKDNTGFIDDEYLMLGELGGEATEIVRIDGAITRGTSLTISATTFAHGTGTPVTHLRYNQVAVYGSTSASDTAPTIIGTAEDIDVSKGNNEIKIASANTKAYYYARYYDEVNTTYSAYSDSIAAAGLSSRARGEIKKEFLSIYNERIDDLISEDWLNRAINRWQRELLKRKTNWACLRASTISDLSEDVQGYAMSTVCADILDDTSNDSIISVKVKDEPWLAYRDARSFAGSTYDYIGSTADGDISTTDTEIDLTDASDFADSGNIYIGGDEIAYTGKTANQLTGVTGIQAAGHSDGVEVWQTYTDGQPLIYTIDNGTMKLDPIPDDTWGDFNLHVEYWKKFPDLSDDADETLFKFPENCYKYLYWQSAIRRKLDESIQIARQADWKDDLEMIVAEDPDFIEIQIGPRNFYKSAY